MATYEYFMVQVPPRIEVRRDTGQGEAAAYLQAIVNQYAAQGWDFYRVDTLGVYQNPGCAGMLTGKKQETTVYYVVSFRRERPMNAPVGAAQGG